MEKQFLMNDDVLWDYADQLLPDDAGIITLFYMYDHNLEEICEIMEITMSNAKTKLCRARQRLKLIVEHKFADQIGI